jgi:hypothetical protein
MSARSANPPVAPRRASRRMTVQPPVKVVAPLPRALKASPQRRASNDLDALRKELREAEAYWTRQYRWVAEVKRMTPEQVMRAWQTAEDWQLPVRHPCVIGRDIVNAQNGRAI